MFSAEVWEMEFNKAEVKNTYFTNSQKFMIVLQSQCLLNNSVYTENIAVLH